MVSKKFATGDGGWGHGPVGGIEIALGSGPVNGVQPWAGVVVRPWGAPSEGQAKYASQVQRLLGGMYASDLKELETALPLLSLQQVFVLARASQYRKA